MSLEARMLELAGRWEDSAEAIEQAITDSAPETRRSGLARAAVRRMCARELRDTVVTLEPVERRTLFDAETLARAFHEHYEKLAPRFDYRTREASAVAWEDVPDGNRRLMIATAGEVLADLRARMGG